MPFSYQAITANCGNSDFGENSTKMLCQLIKSNGSDFYILNLQEADFLKIDSNLKQELGADFQVLVCSAMTTVTNKKSAKSLVMGQCEGIANLIVYNPETIDIQINEQLYTRRFAPERVDSDITGFNKGGVCSTLTLTSKLNPDETIKLQMISGHLDANMSSKRTKDWKNIQEMLSFSTSEINEWAELVSKLPDLRVCGMDCNTRNLSSKPNEPIWTQNHEEIIGFVQFPIGNLRYSSTETYVPPPDESRAIKEEKYRKQGKTLSGSLDLNEILQLEQEKGKDDLALGFFTQTAPETKKSIDITNSEVINTEQGHPRDHKIIISPKHTVSKLGDFERVKQYLAIILKQVAPKLSEQISKLKDLDSSQSKLLDTFKRLLSREGLLFQLLQLHQQKLEFLSRVQKEKHPFVVNTIKQKLLPPTAWLETLELDNLATQIPIIQQEIIKTKAQLDFPVQIQSLAELKFSCAMILQSYGQSRFSFLKIKTSSQNEKTQNIEKLIANINASHSKEDILRQIDAFKKQNELNLSITEHMNQFSTTIHNLQNLLERTSILSKENLPELKQWVIENLYSYSTLSRNYQVRDKTRLEAKNIAINILIEAVNSCATSDEILQCLQYFKTIQPALYSNTASKFSLITEKCIEGIKALNPPEQLGLGA